MPSAYGDLNGYGSQQIWISVSRVNNGDIANNRWTYYGEVRYYGNGYGTYGINGSWSANFGGYGVGGGFAIPYDQRYWQYHTLWSGHFDRYADANGYGSGFTASASIDTDHDGSGDGGVSTYEDAPPRIPKPPAAATITSIVDVAPRSFGVNYTRGNDNGAGIDYDHVQYATDAGFAQITWNDTPPDGYPAGYSNPAGNPNGPKLTPGRIYWVRARSHNGAGWGGWSAAVSQRTQAGGQVRSGGIFRTAIPYVKVAGVWKLALPFVRFNGTWRNTG